MILEITVPTMHQSQLCTAVPRCQKKVFPVRSEGFPPGEEPGEAGVLRSQRGALRVIVNVQQEVVVQLSAHWLCRKL